MDNFQPILHKGRNSQILIGNWKGQRCVLKRYKKSTRIDKRDRCLTEILTLTSLNRIGIDNIPTILTYNLDENWSIISWINGTVPAKASKELLHEIVDFTFNTNLSLDKAQIEYASGAAKSSDFITKNIQLNFKSTLERLISINYSDHAKVINWLDHEIDDLIYILSKNLAKNSYKKHWKDNTLCSTFSQSDVGIHNMICGEDGIYFLDFEYAGLDDLSKFAADIILQPNHHELKDIEDITLKLIYNSGIARNDSWLGRYYDSKIFYLIKWCLIIINSKLNANNMNDINSVIDYFYDTREKI